MWERTRSSCCITRSVWIESDISFLTNGIISGMQVPALAWYGYSIFTLTVKIELNEIIILKKDVADFWPGVESSLPSLRLSEFSVHYMQPDGTFLSRCIYLYICSRKKKDGEIDHWWFSDLTPRTEPAFFFFFHDGWGRRGRSYRERCPEMKRSCWVVTGKSYGNSKKRRRRRVVVDRKEKSNNIKRRVVVFSQSSCQ